MRVESGIPFSGFYNSVWEGEIDSCEDMAIENLDDKLLDCRAKDFEALDDGDIQETLMNNSDYRAMHEEIAKAYVEQFAHEIKEEFGVSVPLTFKELSSPREYNFETDRIFVEVEHKDLVKLYRKVGRKAVSEVAREMFTSRSGFISFYSPGIKDWGSIRDWDTNQMRTIFTAADARIGREDYKDDDRLEALQEKISNIYYDNVDWGKVEKDLQYKLDVLNGEVEPDARKFPESSITDPRLYAVKFAEINHLR